VRGECLAEGIAVDDLGHCTEDAQRDHVGRPRTPQVPRGGRDGQRVGRQTGGWITGEDGVVADERPAGPEITAEALIRFP